jgi:opacity protein-like surface antigen
MDSKIFMESGMKKTLGFLFLVTALCGNLWAADFSFSVGAGGLIGGLFTRYNLIADGVINGNPMKVDAGQEMNQFNYGGLVFFDANYGEFSITIQNGINNWRQILVISGLELNTPAKGDGWESMLGFTLLGKYPFRLGEWFTLFPLLGVEYQAALVQERAQPDGYIYDRSDGLREKDKDGNAYTLSDWNSFFINIGCGADFPLKSNFFVRGEVLYSFRLMTSYETKNLEYMKAMTGDNDPKFSGLTSGPSLRLSAGYRLPGL